MDFMTQRPEWNGMDAILVAINQFSKLTKMAPTKTIVRTFDLMKLFFNMVGQVSRDAVIYRKR
jgi:hypothetical protein